MGFPVAAKKSSTSFARARARSTKISVKQFVCGSISRTPVSVGRAIKTRGKGEDQLVRDDGALVESGGDLDGGPYTGAEVEEEDVDVERICYLELARGEEAAGTGHVADIALFVVWELDEPVLRDGRDLRTFAGLAAVLPGLRLGGHGGQRQVVCALWADWGDLMSPWGGDIWHKVGEGRTISRFGEKQTRANDLMCAFLLILKQSALGCRRRRRPHRREVTTMGLVATLQAQGGGRAVRMAREREDGHMAWGTIVRWRRRAGNTLESSSEHVVAETRGNQRQEGRLA